MPQSRTAGADRRRRVPAVERVLQLPEVLELAARHGRGPLLRELRRLLDAARASAAAGDDEALESLLADLPRRLGERLRAGLAPSLVRVINATGVVVHTNLGRAPLSREAAARVAELATAYSNLEFDLESGARGDREAHAEARLRRLLGVDAALVVNNNAAAVLLAVNTFAEGREVLVSRGELVEIGGSFRIPDVLRKGGAGLREVGTTNRTRLADFRAALTPQTGLILRVHPSNFRILGFSEAPTLEELAALAREARLPLVEDLGSGLLAAAPEALAREPRPEASLRAGADVVTFSGDKLLGGPQAGLVVGRAERLDAMRRNPLYRALRVDKMTIAALDSVLAEHERGRTEGIPVLRMLVAGAAEVAARAAALAEALGRHAPEARLELRPGASAVGGGAAPDVEIDTTLVGLTHPALSAERLAERLRGGTPPVVARVAQDRVWLDLRTVQPHEEAELRDALLAALRS
jgi:L-seryl-tRNA(Ser) seleniumtransferase